MVHCVRSEVYGDPKKSTWRATARFRWRSDSAWLSVYGGRMQLTKHCVQTGSAFWNCGQLGNRQRKRFQTSSDTRRRQLSSGSNAPVESTRRGLRHNKDYHSHMTLYWSVSHMTLYWSVSHMTLYWSVSHMTLYWSVSHMTLYWSVSHTTLYWSVSHMTLYLSVSHGSLLINLTYDSLLINLTHDSLLINLTYDSLLISLTYNSLLITDQSHIWLFTNQSHILLFIDHRSVSHMTLY